LVEQQSEPLAQAWPMTLQVPPGKAAHAPAVQVWVQQSPAPVQGLPTSEQTLSEHVPLLQLFRQQSVPCAQEPPLAWQKVAAAQTVPSHAPLQQGRPATQEDPSATQVPSGPPSERTLPPSGPPFPTDPAQSQAPTESAAPNAARTKITRELRIGLLPRRPGDSVIIGPVSPTVEKAQVGSGRLTSADQRGWR
jgi:hypothetical protein